MKNRKQQHPVYLLRDRDGVYGIGCSIEGRNPARLILRPDRIQASPNLPNVEIKFDLVHRDESRRIALQPIHSSMKPDLVESEFRKLIQRELLQRRGLDYFNSDRPSKGNGWNWWSSNPAQQAKNRRIYFATKGSSFGIVNDLIRKALTSADPDALRIARRFHIDYRYRVYCAAVCSTRVAQLSESFPLLMAAIYANLDGDVTPETQKEAARMVEAGAPLKHIAEFMGIPMTMRRVPPGAVQLASSISWICAIHPKLFEAFLPTTLPKARLWLRGISQSHPWAEDAVGIDPAPEEFFEWTARHCLEIPGTQWDALNTLSNISDWARADDLVRPFQLSMSVRTVMQLSAEWHEAIAKAKAGADYKFPQPWCEAGRAYGYDIVPITGSGELYQEGRAMHHCAASYADRIFGGSSYLYSVRKQGERVATLELHHPHDIAVRQIRGPCNTQASKNVARAVRAWLKSEVMT